jgi:hypothetical protein
MKESFFSYCPINMWNLFIIYNRIEKQQVTRGGGVLLTYDLMNAVNVKYFGAKGDGVTDDTTAIQNAVNSLTSRGSVLVIPSGVYLISTLDIVLPDDSVLICMGLLVTTLASGAAVTIGSRSKDSMRIQVQGLKVQSKTMDWTNNRIGVRLQNIQSSVIDIRAVYGFATNVQLYGTNGVGCVYNELHFGDLIDGQVQIALLADTNGWCNENTCYGGRLSWTSAVKNYTGCVGIAEAFYSVHNLNNNRFICPSIECNSTAVQAAVINGNYTVLMYPRSEGPGQLTFTNLSMFCTFFSGYGAGKTNVVDNGIKNRIFMPDQMTYKGGSSNTGVITSQNMGSSNYKVFTGLDSGGTERFYVKGDGTIFSNENGYFQRGIRWTTGDGTFNDRGLFSGSGSPNNVQSANPGSLYMNTQGGAGTSAFVKGAGNGNTGWRPVQDILSGNTAGRPTNVPIGYCYFETTLSKPVWWNGSTWKDATGKNA